MNKLRNIQKLNNRFLIVVTIFLIGFTTGRLTFLLNYELTNKTSLSFTILGGVFLVSLITAIIIKLRLRGSVE